MDELPVLAADCSRCAGLCCVLLPFRAADGFGVDKPGGTPCHHLAEDNLCTIHDRLATSGWVGCTRYDCQGAGQHVTQVTYAGRDWRSGEVHLAEMAAVFSVVRVLFGRLAGLSPGSTEFEAVRSLTGLPPEDLLALDLESLGPSAG